MIKIFYMDEGIIYEEGTPEEIFENPKKDKTLQFVKKLFVLEEEILSRDYDFEVLVKKIYKQMTQMKSIGNIWHNSVLLLDELINNVLFVLLEDPLHIHLRMECKKDSIVLNVEYGGTELDLKSLLMEKAKSPVGTEKQDDWLPVSARIINSYAEDMTYTRQEGELRNRIRIIVSESAKKGRRTFASRFRHHQSLQAIQKADASPFSPLDTIHTFHVPCADMNCAIRAYDKTETVLKQGLS